jgi:hypothetical protein
VARDVDGRTLASVEDFRPDGAFTLRMRDGEVDAETRAIRPGGGEAA